MKKRRDFMHEGNKKKGKTGEEFKGSGMMMMMMMMAMFSKLAQSKLAFVFASSTTQTGTLFILFIPRKQKTNT